MNTVTEGFFATRLESGPLRHGSFVPEAAKRAQHLCTKDLEDPLNLQRLYEAGSRIDEQRGKLLPLETEMRRALTHRRNRINHAIALLEETPLFENLPTLDPSFLSWRNRECLPGFSIFPIDSDVCRISYQEPRGMFTRFLSRLEIQAESKLTAKPWLPSVLSIHYLNQHLKTDLQQRCEDSNSEAIDLEAKYSGAMPERVRDNIHRWLSRGPLEPRFEHMFIVAEAPNDAWSIKLIPKKDPLVIGVVRGLVFLVDVFDLTPTEQTVTMLCTGELQKINN